MTNQNPRLNPDGTQVDPNRADHRTAEQKARDGGHDVSRNADGSLKPGYNEDGSKK